MASVVSPPHTDVFPFMRLPLELRRMIYEQLVVDATDRHGAPNHRCQLLKSYSGNAKDLNWRHEVKKGTSIVGLLLASKSIMQETADICPRIPVTYCLTRAASTVSDTSRNYLSGGGDTGEQSRRAFSRLNDLCIEKKLFETSSLQFVTMHICHFKPWLSGHRWFTQLQLKRITLRATISKAFSTKSRLSIIGVFMCAFAMSEGCTEAMALDLRDLSGEWGPQKHNLASKLLWESRPGSVQFYRPDRHHACTNVFDDMTWYAFNQPRTQGWAAMAQRIPVIHQTVATLMLVRTGSTQALQEDAVAEEGLQEICMPAESIRLVREERAKIKARKLEQQRLRDERAKSREEAWRARRFPFGV